MNPRQFYELFCARRALANTEGCLMRDDRVRPWTEADEIACAMIERRNATVH